MHNLFDDPLSLSPHAFRFVSVFRCVLGMNSTFSSQNNARMLFNTHTFTLYFVSFYVIFLCINTKYISVRRLELLLNVSCSKGPHFIQLRLTANT